MRTTSVFVHLATLETTAKNVSTILQTIATRREIFYNEGACLQKGEEDWMSELKLKLLLCVCKNHKLILQKKI